MAGSKKALVFVNIGTPENNDVKSVGKYLKKFLMDKYVIDLPFLIRWILVNLIIVPFRAKKSLEAYNEVWTEKGSPLEVYTKELVDESQIKLGNDWLVTYAMSYSKPYIGDTLDRLKKTGVTEIYYLPVYPQYALSTSKSSYEELKKWSDKNPETKVKTMDYFFDDEDFINVSSEKIKYYIKDLEKDTHLLFSFHGLPFRHVKKIHPNHCKNQNSCCKTLTSDNLYCYRAQCYHSAKRIAESLDFTDYSISFQSRLGKDQWLLPYTTEHIKKLAQSGTKKIAVVPYAFIVDCLETEEEVENEIQEAFKKNGGEKFLRVACLNKEFSKVLTPEFFKKFSTV